MTIEWHKSCLANQANSVRLARESFERIKRELADAEGRLQFYREQIAEAEKRGMVAFDSDRLLVKRRV